MHNGQRYKIFSDDIPEYSKAILPQEQLPEPGILNCTVESSMESGNEEVWSFYCDWFSGECECGW